MSELHDQLEELMIELEDGHIADIAIVPGAFKPPHLGHLSMVKEYSGKARQVVVLVSSPLKANRKVGDKTITAENAKAIWEMLLEDQGLSNVIVEISPKPSPIGATYDHIGEDGPLREGSNIILGSSSKGNDSRRWSGASKYVKPGVTLIPPEETSVMPLNMSDGSPFSATDAREKLLRGEDADEFFGPGKTAQVRSILELDEPLEEMSGVGAVAGYGAPMGTKKRNNKKEYNEPELYKEVLKLFSKKGVIK